MILDIFTTTKNNGDDKQKITVYCFRTHVITIIEEYYMGLNPSVYTGTQYHIDPLINKKTDTVNILLSRNDILKDLSEDQNYIWIAPISHASMLTYKDCLYLYYRFVNINYTDIMDLPYNDYINQTIKSYEIGLLSTPHFTALAPLTLIINTPLSFEISRQLIKNAFGYTESFPLSTEYGFDKGIEIGKYTNKPNNPGKNELFLIEGKILDRNTRAFDNSPHAKYYNGVLELSKKHPLIITFCTSEPFPKEFAYGLSATYIEVLP